VFLALTEIRRNRSRFLLIVSIIALITALTLFIAALADGLGSGNIQGLQKLDADLLVFQDKSRLSLTQSALPWERIREVRRVPGVSRVGALGFSSATVPAENTLDQRALDVALVGVQPGLPGEPTVLSGRNLSSERERAVIIDRKAQLRTGLRVGDRLQIRTVQDAKDEFYELNVVGVTDDRQYSLRSTIFVPILTWDRIRPGSLAAADSRDVVVNVLAVQVSAGADPQAVRSRLLASVSDVEVADRKTAWEATPGYKEQQSTLSTQQGFTWFIGLLVIGVFFQIVTLQKVGQVGVLKAMGASNGLIVRSALAQMVLVTAVGVAVGALVALGLASAIPPTVPLSWPAQAIALTVLSLLVMGPLGGLISVRILLKVEPLTALGLAK
jgi:putative ABC transport system permease protein